MRIAYVIPVFPEVHNTFVLNQITGMIDRGHQVDLYPLAGGDYENAQEDVARYDLRSRVVHIPIPSNRIVRLTRALARLARPATWRRSVFAAADPRSGKQARSLVSLYTALSFVGRGPYDIVHVQFGHLGPGIARLVANGGVRASLVTSFRGADTTSYMPRHPDAFRELFGIGSLFLPVSNDLRRRVVAAGAPASRTFVHHSGIDLDRFRFEPRTLAPGQDMKLLFVGRLVEKKGVRFALEALAAVLGTAEAASYGLAAPGGEAGGARRGASLTIVGDGPLRAELEALASRLGVARNVHLEGTRTHADVVRLMLGSHVLVAPSVTAASGDQEGIPNVVKEAMATGMPVISTLHGGIPELVSDGESGYLVPERDSMALASRIEALARHPESWVRLGAAGRAKVEAEFDAERLNDLLVERYEVARSSKCGG